MISPVNFGKTHKHTQSYKQRTIVILTRAHLLVLFTKIGKKINENSNEPRASIQMLEKFAEYEFKFFKFLM